MEGQKDGKVGKHSRQMDEWMDGQTQRWMNANMDGQIDEWTDGWVDGWMDGWVAIQVADGCILYPF